MSRTKKIVSFMLCMIMIFSMSVTAFAVSPDESEITPYVVQVHYINGTDVNFRSGPSTEYSSDGYVNYPEHCTIKYKNGSSYFMDEFGQTDDNGNATDTGTGNGLGSST